MWSDRTELLIGKNGVDRLQKSHVAVVGIGGVGGYVAYLLARAGVGRLTLVDFDVVDQTNINRQIVANVQTVGSKKVDVMTQIILQINPNCDVRAVSQRLSVENAPQILGQNFDYVVDAIDSVPDKVALIQFCKANQIPVVSAMGAGNRIAVPQFKVVDIYQTSHDGLAKVMRKKLRECGVESLDVVTCDTPPIKSNNSVVGSISYFPAMCGCVISAFVTQKLLQKF